MTRLAPSPWPISSRMIASTTSPYAASSVSNPPRSANSMGASGQRRQQVVDRDLVLGLDVDHHQRGAVVDGLEAALGHLAEGHRDQPVRTAPGVGDPGLQRDVEQRRHLVRGPADQTRGGGRLAPDHRPRAVPLDLLQEVGDGGGLGHGQNPTAGGRARPRPSQSSCVEIHSCSPATPSRRLQAGDQSRVAGGGVDGAGGVPDVAVAELAGHVRLGRGVVGRDLAGQVADGGAYAAADVDGAHVARRRGCDGGDQRADHVVDVDEVAGDVAVLVERDRLALAGQAREERDDAGVGVGQRLARGRRRSAAAAPTASCRASRSRPPGSAPAPAWSRRRR